MLIADMPIEEVGSELHTTLISEDVELKAIGPAWKELFARSGCSNVFLSFEWMSTWWTQLANRAVDRLFIVAVHDDGGKLRALAPFYISEEPLLHLRRLGFLGDRLVGSDYLDLLLDLDRYQEIVTAICSFLLQRRQAWDYIELRDTVSDSVGVSIFESVMKDRGMVSIFTDGSKCPFAKLPPSIEEYLAAVGSKLRKNFKYYSRLLQREGSVEFHVLLDTEMIDTAYDALMRLHGERFAMRGGQSAFAAPRVEHFHRAAVRALADSGRCRLHVLTVSGRTVAALYAFSVGSRMMFYQSGMDPEFSRFSVGMILVGSSIRAAIEAGHVEFDFLRGDEEYKSHWATGHRRLRTLHFFDSRAKSRIAWSREAARGFLRVLKGHIRRYIDKQ